MATIKTIRVLTRYTDDPNKEESYIQNELSLDSEFLLEGELVLNRANNKLYHKDINNTVVSLNKPSTMLKLPSITQPTFPVDLSFENVLVVQLVDGVTSSISTIENGYNGAEFTLILKQPPTTTVGGSFSFGTGSGPFSLSSTQVQLLETAIGRNDGDVTIFSFIYLDGKLHLANGTTSGTSTIATTLDGLSDTDIADIEHGELLMWNGIYDWVNQPISHVASQYLDLEDLANIPAPTMADTYLVWNGSTYEFRNIPTGAGGATSFASLDDVNFGSLAVNDLAVWDGVNSWVDKSLQVILVEQDIKLENLSDVVSPSVSNVILEYDGVNWNPIPTPVPGILNDLGDVDVVNPAGLQILAFDGDFWSNQTISAVLADGELGDLGNVPTPTAANDLQYLRWDNSTQSFEWVNALVGQSTDLSIGVQTPTTLEVVSTTGTNVVLPEATPINAGLLSSADKNTIDNLSTLSDADNIVVDPVGNLGSNNVQAALEELQGDIDSLSLSSHSPVTVTDDSIAISGQAINVKLDTTTGSGNNIITVTSEGLYAGPLSGSATDLSLINQTDVSLEIDSSTGVNVVLNKATATDAGLLSGPDQAKLDTIAINANNYTHPNHTGDVTSVNDGVTTIVDDVVTNAKLANVSTNTIKGRITTGSGDPEDLTPAQVRALINVEDGATAATDLSVGVNTSTTLQILSSNGSDVTLPPATALYAGLFTATEKTKLDSVDFDANNYVHPDHTGDVTSTGDGATAIVDGVVTNAKLADVSANTLKGRVTVGFGDPEDLTPAQVRALINVEDGATADQVASEVPVTPTGNLISNNVQAALEEIQGDIDGIHDPVTLSNDSLLIVGQALSVNIDSATGGGDNILTLTPGEGLYVPPGGGTMYTHPDHTGDVTSTGDGATTIVDNVVTNAKLADVDTATLKGRVTAGSGDPEDLTPAQVRTLINVENGATADQIASEVPVTPTGDLTSTNVQAALEELQGDIDGIHDAVTATDDSITLTDQAINVNLDTTTGGGNNVLTLTPGEGLYVPPGGGSYVHPDHTGDVTSTGDGATTIVDNVVTNAKLADVDTATLKGRVTAGSGDPEDLTPAQVRTLINVEDGATADQIASEVPVTPSGNLTSTEVQAALEELQGDIDGIHDAVTATDDSITLTGQAINVNLDTTTGGGDNVLTLTPGEGLYVAPGSYVHPDHTGDVTSTGDGATTIVDNVVTNAKLADVDTATLKGRVTAGSGDPEDLTPAQVRTLINVEDGATADQIASEVPVTPSGNLTSTNVQAALEELQGEIGGDEIAFADVPADISTYFTDIEATIDCNASTGHINGDLEINAGSSTCNLTSGSVKSRTQSNAFGSTQSTITISNSKLVLTEPMFRDGTLGVILNIKRSEVIIKGTAFIENGDVTVDEGSTLIIEDGSLLCSSISILGASKVILKDSTILTSYTGDGTVASNINMEDETAFHCYIRESSSLIANSGSQRVSVFGNLDVADDSHVSMTGGAMVKVGGRLSISHYSKFTTSNTVYINHVGGVSVDLNSHMILPNFSFFGQYDDLVPGLNNLTYQIANGSTMTLNNGQGDLLLNMTYTGTSSSNYVNTLIGISGGSTLYGDAPVGTINNAGGGSARFSGPVLVENNSTIVSYSATYKVPVVLKGNSVFTTNESITFTRSLTFDTGVFGIELYDQSQFVILSSVRLRFAGPCVRLDKGCSFTYQVITPSSGSTFESINDADGVIQCYNGGNSVSFLVSAPTIGSGVLNTKPFIYAEGSVNVEYVPSVSNFSTNTFLKATGPNVFVSQDAVPNLKYEYVDNYSVTPSATSYSSFTPDFGGNQGYTARQDYIHIVST